MIDIAITLAKNNYLYSGSVTDNTEDNYNLIRWEDVRQKPSWKELNLQWIIINSKIKKDNCKNKAKSLIANSDWSVLPDVNITNKSDFENYRSQLRNLILNPVEDPTFPEEPNPIWS
jgi:hypothetical protein